MAKKKIDLKAYTFRPAQPSFTAGNVLRKVRQNHELEQASQRQGLITDGFLEVTQVEGGFGWAISDYISFSYKYFRKPIFTWGQEGTYTGTDEITNPYELTGDNTYSRNLPSPLQAFIDAEDYSTYQPAMFIPRVIHWHRESSFYYVGCYLLVMQVNSNCNEVDKLIRIHFRFEGYGIPKE